MKQKNALIMGDSYSTFIGFIPKNYATYYPTADVTEVSHTWWNQVINEAGLNLLENNSWSGSTIGYTGYSGYDCSKDSSFIFRLNKLKEEGFFERNEVNSLFIFGGTNDSWSNAPLGQMQYDGFQKQDLHCVLPAVCCLFKNAREILPEAEIYCLVNTDLKNEISEALQTAAVKFGITPVVLKDIDKTNGHPTKAGMITIKEQVLKAMKKVED